MLAGTALYIRLLVYVGLSLFIISGIYVYMVVCIVYAYNLTLPACIPSFLNDQGIAAIMLFYKVEKALQPLLSLQINLTLKAFISST